MPSAELICRIAVGLNIVVFVGLNMIFDVRLKKRGIDPVGASPIGKPAFVVGKLSMVLCWLVLLLAVIGVNFSLVEPILKLQWVALFLFVVGNVFAGLSQAHLGDSGKVGLPVDEQTELRTCGIYKVSRNPMYVGFHLVSLAACLYTLNVVAVVSAVIAIAIHHRIILSEERFLASRFGEEWKDYVSKVRRYV